MVRIFIPGDRELYHNYHDAVRGCGGETAAGGNIDDFSVCTACDGLLLPGGSDLNPARYGEQNIASEGIDDLRDAWEAELIHRFYTAGKPVLGICRGHQAINVAFGGSLIQNVADVQRHSRSGTSEDRVHRIRVQEESFLARLYRGQCGAQGTIPVNSSHHQAVKALAPDFVVAAVCEDGIVEAIVHRSAPVIGIQFHPERMCFAHKRDDTVDGRPIFEYFLELCVRGMQCEMNRGKLEI